MKLLILGGTAFLGRHLVDVAITRGHSVTAFLRGTHGPPSSRVKWIQGDRRRDLTPLGGRRWDAAIDTSGYVPSDVRRTATVLSNQVRHYTFVSTLSVYADDVAGIVDESAAVQTVPDEMLPALEAIEPSDPIVARNYGANYGGLKARCEQAASEAMSGRTLVVRPGLIVGPYDYSDRFTYWPTRVAGGGEVLAPGDPHCQQRFIDVRDLADWMIRAIEEERQGVYNATGPSERLSMSQLLDACHAVTGSDGHFTWVDDAFLVRQGVTPWTELPLWAPRLSMLGPFRANCDRAMSQGLQFRPIEQTIRDTWQWDSTRPPGRERRAGLRAARERELLSAWHSR